MKRIAKLQLAALLTLAAGQAPAQIPGKHAAEVKAIEQNEVRWCQDFGSKNLEKMMAHYTDDAVMIAPGFPAFKGREAIRAALQMMIADPAMSMKFQTSRVEVAPSGDMASSVGTFVVTMTDPATKKVVTTEGNYVTVYRKQGPDWKAVFDIASPGSDPAGGQKE